MEKYMVLYKRDVGTEMRKGYESSRMMLFDKVCEFGSLNEARGFYFNNLPGILMERAPFDDVNPALLKDVAEPFVVVAKFHGKYKHYDYGGGCESLVSYDVVRSSAEDVNKNVERFSGEGYLEKIIVGLERSSMW